MSDKNGIKELSNSELIDRLVCLRISEISTHTLTGESMGVGKIIQDGIKDVKKEIDKRL